MEFLSEYGLFLLKVITLVIGLLLTVAGLFAIGKKGKSKLEVSSLSKAQEETRKKLLQETKKTQKLKQIEKKKKEIQLEKPIAYVIDFHGDIKASQADSLRELITAILTVVEPHDEVVVRLESPGGTVNGYGLAASQLQRIRDKNISLTVCVDKIAASGGYLMACVANQLVAAPFAIIGSIGVVAQLPNFHRWLKKNNIDVELLTAGEFKRTLTLFAENTNKGRQKFQEDLEAIHHTFKNYILNNRPQLDVNKVSTGEHWLAKDALDLNLVDRLQTSDDYLAEKNENFDIFHLKIPSKPSLAEKLTKPLTKLFAFHPFS